MLTELIDEPEDHKAFKVDAAWVDTVIRDFVEVDRGGAVFRYPTDTEGQPHLIDLSLINAGTFGESMVKLHQIFENLDHLVSAAIDMRTDYLSNLAEMQADYRAEMKYNGDEDY